MREPEIVRVLVNELGIDGAIKYAEKISRWDGPYGGVYADALADLRVMDATAKTMRKEIDGR